jgi:cytochrome oxidase assembly protein ShyY1
LILVPFETEDGLVIAVERGWVPTGSLQDYPDWIPTVNSDFRTVEIRVRAGEPDLNRQQVDGQLASIDLADLAQRIAEPKLATSFYGRLVKEEPASTEYAIQMPAPSLDEGNHLSYALQWILFGLMAFAALIWAIRAEIRQQKIRSGKLIEKHRKKSRAETDADYEDGLQPPI